MKILVTGASGFIGTHVIHRLTGDGHVVVATSANASKASLCKWFGKVTYLDYKIGEMDHSRNLFSYFGEPDLLIHLAWQGLPDYKQMHHVEKNLLPQYFFIKNLVENGLRNITVTGTCFEYGMQSGPLKESLTSLPENPYALAKDSLRKFIEALQKNIPFSFKWVRLFYMYGDGQNPNSILPLLQKAIDNGDTEFRMSGGEQLRDYMHVSEVANNISAIATQTAVEGIINCCSGSPVSVRRLVENQINERGSDIKIRLGHYPYPDYEPMAFWGDRSKLNKIIG
jgi:dTDP-6-deoxy-L-talose 4-dehydrogenase (NAD+)